MAIYLLYIAQGKSWRDRGVAGSMRARTWELDLRRK